MFKYSTQIWRFALLNCNFGTGWHIGCLGTLGEAAQILTPFSYLRTNSGRRIKAIGIVDPAGIKKNYQHGIMAILSRAQGDFNIARSQLAEIAFLPLAIMCLHKLHQDLQETGI